MSCRHFSLPLDISLSIGEISIEEVSVEAGERAPKEVHARRL
jgi:hypothetical protein